MPSAGELGRQLPWFPSFLYFPIHVPSSTYDSKNDMSLTTYCVFLEQRKHWKVLVLGKGEVFFSSFLILDK